VRAAHTCAGARARRTRPIATFRLFVRAGAGRSLAPCSVVIWFLERESHLIVCEIRRAADDEEKFEFEIADAAGPTTQRFDSPTDLISAYLHQQSRLLAQGWRPRNADTLE
jgi:hypothetical protein